MQTLKDLQKEKGIVLDKLSKIEEQIKDFERKTLVLCTNNNHGKGCGMGLEIGALTYIQTHWYESPHGCMGGDTWHMGEGNFICPKCEHRNRLYNRPEIEELKYLFKNIIEEHNYGG